MSSEDEDAPPARKTKRDQEDEDDDGPVDLFPLEGKYRDAEDRAA